MKKILTLCLLSIGVAVHAQTEKGSWYLGGSGGFSTGSTTQGPATIKRSSWSFSPEVGTFLSDHIQLGLGLTSGGIYYNSPSSSSKNFQFGGTVYSRYLFGNAAFRPFLGISAGYLAGRTNLSPSTNNYLNTVNANFTAGFAYYVTPRIGIFGSIGVLGYTYSRTQSGEVSNDLGFNVSTLGNRFTIGMYYTFCKGKGTE